MRRITKVKRSIRAISPVIATLLMIAIAVVASLVVYAWVLGYIGGATTKASNSMLIQSTSHTTDNFIVVYVQNVGQGTIELQQTQSTYVNSVLKGITDSTPTILAGMVTFAPGSTATLVTDYPYTANEKLKIKITATDGTFAEYTTTGTSGTSGGTFGSHTITPSAASWSHISPSVPTSVVHGGSQTFQMWSDSGYHISDVLIDGRSIGIQLTYKFTNVDADHTINAISTLNPAGQQMILATAGPNGVITPSGQVFVSNGGSQTFQIRPDVGYHVAGVLVDGSSVGAVTSYQFTAVTASHTISATFEADVSPTHTITVSSGANGQITPGTGPVNHGTDKTYTITANSGYLVDDVVIDGTSIGSRVSYTFENVVADHTISATFTSIPSSNRVIHASAGANGMISPVGDVTVINGHSQAFTITPDSHYHVADVLVDGTSRGAITSYTFSNVVADHTISATFAINTLTITASAQANGQISPTGSVTVNYGADQTFNIQPNTGYLVADVLIDGSSVGSRSSYTFTNVVASHTISVSFAAVPQNTNVIQASAGAHGAINPAGSVTVIQGSSQAFTITPDSHYHVSDVLVDGTSVGAVTSYTFTNVLADHTISATFAIDTLRITATAGANGQISPSGLVIVNYGADQAFTITPNSGYIVGSLTVDGAATGFGTAYTFTNVIADHTIAVTFTPGSTTLINTGFDSDPWDESWHAGGNPPWFGAIGQGIGGTTAAKSDIATDGPFTSNQISTTSGKTLRITFMYKVLNTNNANDFRIAYSYVNNPNLNQGSSDFTYLSPGLGRPASDNVWYAGSVTLTSQQYFSFRFESNLSTNAGGLQEQIWVDNVIITISQ